MQVDCAALLAVKFWQGSFFVESLLQPKISTLVPFDTRSHEGYFEELD